MRAHTATDTWLVGDRCADAGSPSLPALVHFDGAIWTSVTLPGLPAGVKDWITKVVPVAADGREALARAAELRPDAVLMDIRMPRMDGVEATARLAAADRPPAHPPPTNAGSCVPAPTRWPGLSSNYPAPTGATSVTCWHASCPAHRQAQMPNPAETPKRHSLLAAVGGGQLQRPSALLRAASLAMPALRAYR